jgi:H+/Cl- antiporter ClcA
VRYLQILNAVLLALGSVMGLILAVVCLLYGVHVAGEPRLADELPRLFVLTGLFAGVAGAGGLALLAHRREWMLRWPLQALPLAPLAGILMFVLSLR